MRRAYSQLNSAVRTPPRCSRPVGLGAKRVTTVMLSVSADDLRRARMLPRAAAGCLARAQMGGLDA